jgi:hypothetical protein
VDQQATRRARTDPRATFDPSRLSGSQGVTPSLKVTVIKSQTLIPIDIDDQNWF